MFLPSAVYALVILVLLLRPGGLFAPRGATTAERRVRRLSRLTELLGPAVLVVSSA